MVSLSKAMNLLFIHKKRLAIGAAFTTTYIYGLNYIMYNSKNEILRLGVAGSFATLLVETGCHFIDTTNVRSKSSKNNRNFF